MMNIAVIYIGEDRDRLSDILHIAKLRLAYRQRCHLDNHRLTLSLIIYANFDD